jgi:hypothetical protein
MLTAAEFAKVQAGLKAAARRPGHVYGGARQGRRQRAHRADGNDARRARLGRPVRRRRVDVTQIFAMHIGMLGQAASMGGDGLGKFGKIMQGPWGLAIIAGIAILATLISKHHEAGRRVDEPRREDAQAGQRGAQPGNRERKIWAKSIDGVREAQEKLRKELEQSLKVEAASRSASRRPRQIAKGAGLSVTSAYRSTRTRPSSTTTRRSTARAIPSLGRADRRTRASTASGRSTSPSRPASRRQAEGSSTATRA